MIPYQEIASVGLSPYQDNFLILGIRHSYSSLLETPLKTELINAMKYVILTFVSLNKAVLKQLFIIF